MWGPPDRSIVDNSADIIVEVFRVLGCDYGEQYGSGIRGGAAAETKIAALQEPSEDVSPLLRDTTELQLEVVPRAPLYKNQRGCVYRCWEPVGQRGGG